MFVDLLLLEESERDLETKGVDAPLVLGDCFPLLLAESERLLLTFESLRTVPSSESEESASLIDQAASSRAGANGVLGSSLKGVSKAPFLLFSLYSGLHALWPLSFLFCGTKLFLASLTAFASFYSPPAFVLTY